MRRLLAALCCAAAAAEPYGDPFDFFDKIYVVGVNESSGPARATAAALGLDIEVVDAVKPPERDGDFDAIRDQFTADALDDLSSGEIATSLSHRKALRAFLATTAETALIFEDDFAPSGVGLRARLRSVLHHLPPVWRVLYLGSCRANCGLEDRVGGDVFRTTSALCLHAFAVTRDGAERVLAGVRKCRPDLSSEVARRQSRCPADQAVIGAAKESDIPNFKGSFLGRFPLVLADFWTSDRLSERSRSVDAFSGTRARGTLTLKRT